MTRSPQSGFAPRRLQMYQPIELKTSAMTENNHDPTRKRQLPRGWWLAPCLLVGALLWVFIIKGMIALVQLVTG